MRRNLYFYLYPARGSLWPWHLDRLREFWPVFNGRKVIVVATDGAGTEAVAEVRRRLQGLPAHLIVRRNAPKLWQTNSFLAGLAELRSLRDDEITFYAHGKGVSRHGALLPCIRSWCEAMYFMNLASPKLIERLARRYAAVGCFRQEMPHAGSSWHYAGAFFWFKHSALFARHWKSIRQDRFGVEGYLGRHIPIQESFSLTPFRHFSRLHTSLLGRARCRRWLRDMAGRMRYDIAARPTSWARS